MTSKKEIYNFLSNFSPEDLVSILSDLQAVNQGYNIYYIVDTYDIINYVLPFTNESKFDKKNKNELSHKTIAYDSVFDNSQEKNLIVLDEYKIELLSVKNEIVKKLKGFPKVKKQLLDILSENDINEEKDLNNAVKLIKNNFDIIIALQIFIEYGDNIYNRFLKLLNKNLHIFNYDTESSSLDPLIVKIFDENRPSNIAQDLYDLFVKEVQYRLLKLESDIDRFVYLENAYRDIAVIDRILKVNHTFGKKFPEKKIIFHYLSSTPYKTPKLFSLLQEMNLKYSLDINRNIFQCYLLRMLKGLDSKRYPVQDTMSLLFDALQEKLFVEKSSSIIQSDNNSRASSISTVLSKLLSDSANDIKNTFLYNSYEEQRSNLENALKNIKAKSQRKILFDFFNKTERYIDENLTLIQSFESASLNIQRFRQTYILANRFKINKEFVHELEIPYGKDIIRNAFQHLPVLLLLFEEENDYKNSLYRIFDYILKPNSTKEENPNLFNKFVKTILNQLANLSAKSLKDLTIDFLLLSYLNLITKSSPTFDKAYRENLIDNEDEILSILESQKRILESSSIEVEKNIKEQKLEIKSKRFEYEKEIDYMILWLNRRNHSCIRSDIKTNHCEGTDYCNFNKAIEFGLMCIKKYKDDGRFQHGLALAFHAKAYGALLECKFQSDTNERVLGLLHSSRKYLIRASHMYRNLENEIKEELPLLMLRKNIIAIHNTIADGYLREHEIKESENNKLLIKVRKEIDIIKFYFSVIGSKISDFPTLSHTKAELNFREANYYFKNQKYSDALEKIIVASSFIQSFENNKQEIKENFRNIIKQINSLRFKIFSALGFFK